MTSNQPFPFRGASEENLLYGLQKQQQQQQQNLSNQAMNPYPSLTNQQQYQLQQQSNNNNTMNDLLQIQRHMTGHSSTNSNVRGGRGGGHPGGLSAVAAMASATGNISNYTAGGVTGPGATSTMNTNATILAGAPSSLQQQQQQQQANNLALSMGMRYTNPRLGLGAGVSVNPSSTTTSRGGAPGFASHSQIMESALGALHQQPQAAGVGAGAGNTATTAALLQNPSRRHSSLGFRLGDLMGPSTTTTASTKTTANRIGNNNTGTNTASNISERRSSLELLGEVALDAERRGKKRRHGSDKLPNSPTNASANPIATNTSILDSNQDSIMMNAILRNSGPSTTATAPTTSSNNNTTTNGPLSELDLVKRKADLEYMLQQNELELKQKRRTSLDLALKQEQQRRNSLELVQRRNSLELAAAVAQRRNSLELAQRRNSLELALQRQRQEQELQRRGSLELALQQQQQQQQQRRNSLELALQQQQRRSSLELGRRNSLGSVDLTSPRRFSLDHLYPRRNSTDFLRNNDAFMKSHLLAEQLLGISGGAAVDGRRSSLAMDRRLSNLQMGNNNPIDPNHLDSLFDDGTQTGLALGLRAGETTDPSLLLALRRHSLLQSLNQTNSSNAQTLANQAQLLNTQLAAAAQQQQHLQQASATTNTNMNNNNTTNNNDGKYPELMHEQVSPFFLKSFESLQEKMQQSQLSQKSIQSWDKKMGLKRSHSSTMTKTHRSRKQLRELFELQKKVLEQRLGKKKDDKSKNAQRNKPNDFN